MVEMSRIAKWSGEVYPKNDQGEPPLKGDSP
jgi:hypothetical protein